MDRTKLILLTFSDYEFSNIIIFLMNVYFHDFKVKMIRDGGDLE